MEGWQDSNSGGTNLAIAVSYGEVPLHVGDRVSVEGYVWLAGGASLKLGFYGYLHDLRPDLDSASSTVILAIGENDGSPTPSSQDPVPYVFSPEDIKVWDENLALPPAKDNDLVRVVGTVGAMEDVMSAEDLSDSPWEGKVMISVETLELIGS